MCYLHIPNQTKQFVQMLEECIWNIYYFTHVFTKFCKSKIGVHLLDKISLLIQLQLKLNCFTCWQVIMKYIQKGHVDDKLVSQLLQVHQTVFVTCGFLFNIYFQVSSTTNQTIVFGKQINLLNSLTPKTSFLNRLIFFHRNKKNLFINASSISIIFCCTQFVVEGHWF